MISHEKDKHRAIAALFVFLSEERKKKTREGERVFLIRDKNKIENKNIQKEKKKKDTDDRQYN